MISAAAAAHGVTQPAASMRLRALERLLKIPLLERSTTGAPYSGGHGHRGVGDHRPRRHADPIGRHDGAPGGPDVSTVPGCESHRRGVPRPRWLHRLVAEAPDTKVSLEVGNTADVAELVARGDVELGFIEGPGPRGVAVKEVLADELVIVVPGSSLELSSWPDLRRELANTPGPARAGLGHPGGVDRALGARASAPRPQWSLAPRPP